MEKKVFTRSAVAERLQPHFVEARLHNDGDVKAEVKALQRELVQSLATPVYLVMDPASGEILSKQFGPTLSSDEPFIEFLDKGLARSTIEP